MSDSRLVPRLKTHFWRVLILAIAISSVLGHWSAVHSTSVLPESRERLTIQTLEIASIDRVPPQFELGQQLYIENCSTCHIAIPPQVLPSQTWRQLIQDSDHYGRQIEPLVDPPRLLVWNYLQTFSRPINLQDEQLPFRLDRSRFFRAIHPRVEFNQPISVNNCAICHPAATDYNFRKLTPEWIDSP